MHTLRYLLSVLLLLIAPAARGDELAFLHVTVLPMDGPSVLTDQTVVISGDRIERMGPSSQVRIPAGTRTVDGSGAFLLPGLADMHVHFAPPGKHAAYDALNRKWALQLVANGITTVRNMAGFPGLLVLRGQMQRGEAIGPDIYTTGPDNNGGHGVPAEHRRIETVGDARAAVRQDRTDGFDAIKVYSGLNATAYRALVTEARALGLPVYGHVPDSVGLAGVLEAHQDSIEHLSGYLAAVTSLELGVGEGRSIGERRYDPSSLRSVALATRGAGTWNCPTLVMLQSLGVRWRGLPTSGSAWGFRTPGLFSDSPELPRLAAGMLEALHEAEAGLLIGTDSDGDYVTHGYSMQQELCNFISAGYSPYEVLKAATSDAARFLGKGSEFGAVAPGRLANLILVQANPLQDVRNVSRRIGVMLRGRWYSQAELEGRLKAFEFRANNSRAFSLADARGWARTVRKGLHEPGRP